jgi:4-hydroxy-3-methylbut-2-en-1-yl diphosphate synthase IspG/GcpE
MTLHLIPPAPKPEEPVNNRAKRASKPADMIQCPRCGGREVMETVIGAMIQARKLKGGTRQIICVGCLLNGERVVVA